MYAAVYKIQPVLGVGGQDFFRTVEVCTRSLSAYKTKEEPCPGKASFRLPRHHWATATTTLHEHSCFDFTPSWSPHRLRGAVSVIL